MIRVWAMLDNRIVRSSLLRLNGKAGETSTAFTTGVSLAGFV